MRANFFFLWLQAMKNCSNDLTFIQDNDNEILKHLYDIRVKVAMKPELHLLYWNLNFNRIELFTITFSPNNYILHNSSGDQSHRMFSRVAKMAWMSWKMRMNRCFEKKYNPHYSSRMDYTDTDSTEIQSNISNKVILTLTRSSKINWSLKCCVLYHLTEIDNDSLKWKKFRKHQKCRFFPFQRWTKIK